MTANAIDRHRWGVELLDPSPADQVLEVGCGHGVTASLIGARLQPGAGTILGIDRSATMIAAASVRNAELIADGRAAFVTSTFVEATLPDRSFDAIVAFHVAAFWNDPAPMLGRAADVLAPDGRLVLLNQLPGWNQRAEPDAFADRLRAVLDDHGWVVADRIVADQREPVGLCVIARPG